MTSTQQRIALVIGAAGGIGGEAATALVRHGWTVRALTRRAQPARSGIEWVSGDAMVAADVARVARGAALIVHAANPPGYKDWDKLVLPMLDNTIAAARTEGARVLLPGTVYNFGLETFPLIDETAPQNPTTRKGKIRVEMERRLQAASTQGVPVLIVRAGDFFGPHAGNNWFGQAVVKPGGPLTSVTEPLTKGLSHAWAYLPDLAETMARLLDRADRLGSFAVFHFGGHLLAWGEMAASVRRVTGQPRLPVKSFPWPLVVALSPFVRLFGEMAEMRYLWREPMVLNDGKLRAFLGGDLPSTPLDTAVAASLRGMGCLETARTVIEGEVVRA
ncbi:nucleoside-diphosphate-sugar epimerase [Caulobacter sp. AP07]|uniref:NAD-dependent epimerase/dehydratase family protein n=1 Tax=Caulobacter sp. AP07 TaxID=1144304 RepID=UPI000271F2D0|nr:NAD-dependent epimerase/dehydratase family protein [Caulobacter sp. AP07]EJL27962.1 nucleoside-diphosphate-sugar epimerase [Caulobacter sp. AP07]